MSGKVAALIFLAQGEGLDLAICESASDSRPALTSLKKLDQSVRRGVCRNRSISTKAAQASIFKGLAASDWQKAAAAMRFLVDGGLP